MDDALKRRVIEYFNVDTWLFFAQLLYKILATRLILVGLLFTSRCKFRHFGTYCFHVNR